MKKKIVRRQNSGKVMSLRDAALDLPLTTKRWENIERIINDPNTSPAYISHLYNQLEKPTDKIGPKIKARPTVPVTKEPLPPPKKKSKRKLQNKAQDKSSRLKRKGMRQSVDTDPYQKLGKRKRQSTDQDKLSRLKRESVIESDKRGKLEQRKQILIDRLENPDKYKNEPTFLAPRKKNGGKITYKMTGGQVVDISYE